MKHWLPVLPTAVWILAIGRLLSQVGTGFTMFYATIFFVNRVGLSAAAVGFAVGLGSMAGVGGRIVGGSLADSPTWGRRKTLLLSAAVSAVGSFVLAVTYDLPLFIVGSMIMGVGVGLYWPATEAAVADLTTEGDRNEAYALTRLGDTAGLGLGVILGGLIISTTGAYRLLYWVDGLSYLVFFGIIYAGITETARFAEGKPSMYRNWGIALRDRPLLIYVIVNILLTLYFAQIQSVLPLYLTNFVRVDPLRSPPGFAAATISGLITWHIVLAAALQLPVARWLRRFRHPQSLMLSAILWCVGFSLVGITGLITANHLAIAGLSLAILGLACIAYLPSASAFVADLAPESLRGIYLSINSLCWAIGYFLGPPVGGWALDQSKTVADLFWFGLAATTLALLPILHYLDGLRSPSPPSQQSP